MGSFVPARTVVAAHLIFSLRLLWILIHTAYIAAFAMGTKKASQFIVRHLAIDLDQLRQELRLTENYF